MRRRDIPDDHAKNSFLYQHYKIGKKNHMKKYIKKKSIQKIIIFAGFQTEE